MKTEPYVSSICTKFGDLGNVPRDSQTLKDIIDRQGVSLLIRAIAEYVGMSAVTMYSHEANRLRDNVIEELREDINERI